MARTKQPARQTGGKAPWSIHTKPLPKGEEKEEKEHEHQQKVKHP